MLGIWSVGALIMGNLSGDRSLVYKMFTGNDILIPANSLAASVTYVQTRDSSRSGSCAAVCDSSSTKTGSSTGKVSRQSSPHLSVVA